MTETKIRRSWPCGLFNDYLLIVETSKQLATRFWGVVISLLVLGKVIQDSSSDDEALSRLADFKYDFASILLPLQMAQSESLAQVRSS